VSGRLLPGLTPAVYRRAPVRPSRGPFRWLPLSARGLLRWLLGSPVPSLQRAPPRGLHFPRLRPLSTEDIRINFPWGIRLLLEDDCIRAVYSPSTTLASGSVSSTDGASDTAWGGGSGHLSGWRGILFSHYRAGFIFLPGQVHGLSAQYATGCQPTTTTKLHVLLGKDLHIQARPDYCHGWGAKYAGNVD
jgi:hypothetical protein